MYYLDTINNTKVVSLPMYRGLDFSSISLTSQGISGSAGLTTEVTTLWGDRLGQGTRWRGAT